VGRHPVSLRTKAKPRPQQRRRSPMHERIRARRREIHEEEARRLRRWKLNGLAVVVLVAAAVAASQSPLFAITEIRLTGVNAEREAELRDFMPLQTGENMLAADLGRVERRLEQVPWVRAVDAVRLPPSTVEIRVEERQPAAVVRLAGGVWTVDGDGVVLSPGAQPGLVVIEAPNSVLPGVGIRASDAAVRNALAVHAALPPRWRQAVDRYDAPSERGLRLHLSLQPGSPDGGIWVRFGSAERGGAKSRGLEALLAEVQRAPVPVAEIDVRAPGNPVLVPRSRAWR
jgi:cell division protein FtsQ